jgi:excisionase family DNA binding protein
MRGENAAMAVLANTPESVLSPVDIPPGEQREIIELYRNALLSGSQAQLVSPTGQSLRLPRQVYSLLTQILKELSEGSSVAIIQERPGLTTVQASRLLGVSRQFFVNTLEKGDIPFHMVGTHRRVLLKDLMDYKIRRDRARRDILKQMVESELEAGVHEVVPDDFSGQ